MTYETAEALRMALEQRLLARSKETKVSLDRLRRRVLFERTVSRLQAAEPGQWVLKGGMALEVRLLDEARLTKDIDLGLRGDVADAEELRERLVEALSTGVDGDEFTLIVGPVKQLIEDDGGHLTWRVKVVAELAGRHFGAVQVDVSPRSHELDATDLLPLPNSLEFAGVLAPLVEIVDVNRHAAEKFHGMLRKYGDRDNTRVRDLVDLVILTEHELLEPAALAAAIRLVWSERDGANPPATLPSLPPSWLGRYELLVAEHDVEATSFPAAVSAVAAMWAGMFPTEET
ncbi:MAG: nucleotidyl transferase AbiEii/AbiGii toxin family protein [Solirubrobacteraceae bacterium]